MRTVPALAALVLLISACAPAPTRPLDVAGVVAPRDPLPTQLATARPAPPPGGVVAAPHPQAASAGDAVLRAGGTAYDAAIAAALVIGVVANQSSGLGGGGFAVHRSADGELGALDFREVAPSFFSADTFAEEERNSRRGAWAVGVPGEAAGLAELHRLGGRLSWAEVVEPALVLARDGFVVDSRLAKTLARYSEEVLADPGMAADFSRAGEVLKEGDRCVRPALAQTLAYLRTHGGDAFYGGPIAVAISGFLAGLGAPWTPSELEAYRTVSRVPLSGTHRGHTIVSMPPPSSGGIALIQILGILDRRPDPESGAARARLLAGAMSHAFADRAAYGGDPAFIEVPVDDLTDDALLDRLAAGIPESGPILPVAAGLSGERSETTAPGPDDGGTTHISVMDGAGAAIALTTTVNLSFGAAIQDPATGVLLNDEMDDFTARPGAPNAFGLLQGEANKVEPGKRPLSSMTPSLVLDPEGRAILSVGGAGGPRIITATLQTLLAVLDGATAADAVAAPRIHHQWMPTTVFAEDDAFAQERALLVREGFEWGPLNYAGLVQATAFDPDTGRWSGGADPRGNGGVEVWQP